MNNSIKYKNTNLWVFREFSEFPLKCLHKVSQSFSDSIILLIFDQRRSQLDIYKTYAFSAWNIIEKSIYDLLNLPRGSGGNLTIAKYCKTGTIYIFIDSPDLKVNGVTITFPSQSFRRRNFFVSKFTRNVSPNSTIVL